MRGGRPHESSSALLLIATCLVTTTPATCGEECVRDEAVSLLQVSVQHGPGEEQGALALDHALHTYPKVPPKYENLTSALNGLNLTAAEADPLHAYRKVSELLGQRGHNENFTTIHSHQIFKYVSTLKSAPRLSPGGCLYLPSDRAWKAFYKRLEHPYPPMFAEMVANAFYPNCSDTSVSGVTLQKCKDGNIRSPDGCIKVKLIGMGGSVHIFASEGHIGLPYSWSRHVRRKSAQLSMGGSDDESDAEERLPMDTCATSIAPLPAVPQGKRLVLPTRVIVCAKKERQFPSNVEDVVKEQIRWTNEGYAGRNPFSTMSFDLSAPPQVDMQIMFDLKSVEVQHDEMCATQTFGDLSNAAPFNTNGSAWFTIILVADDETGVLGMSTFPTERTENSSMLLVAISVRGLRHWREYSGEQWDESYNEGHTMTHEVGHALGVFHTFEGGCSENGDQVPDTMPEAYPHYTCQPGSSCSGADPVHNFMDYSPDHCMAGFTEYQKRRAWCIVERYRPTMFRDALKERS